MSIFRFFRGPVGLGTGTANLGLARSHAIPVSSNSTPRDIPRRSLGPCEGAMMYTGKKAIARSLEGNGSEVHGTFQLQPLAVRQRG